MLNLIKKTRSDLAVLTGILLLVMGAHDVKAQHDTATEKQFLKDTVIAVKLFQQKVSFPTLYNQEIPQRLHSFTGYPLLTPYIYRPVNENKLSKTILTVLGIGALSIFGDRTNHSYQPYNQHW